MWIFCGHVLCFMFRKLMQKASVTVRMLYLFGFFNLGRLQFESNLNVGN